MILVPFFWSCEDKDENLSYSSEYYYNENNFEFSFYALLCFALVLLVVSYYTINLLRIDTEKALEYSNSLLASKETRYKINYFLADGTLKSSKGIK